MRKHATIILTSLLIVSLILFPLVYSLPAAPSIIYVSNSSATATLQNRSTDTKGTITTLLLSANQQDYKWKAYVGNVTGTLALDDANGYSIYDWDLGGTSSGKVFVSKYSNITWTTISCANQTSVDTEQSGVGMSSSARDSINSTFNATNHRSFNVSTVPMSSCRSTATYVNDTAQSMGSSALFQEILLMDTSNLNLIYTTIMEVNVAGYNTQLYDFQIIVAENESATVPTQYFFWVELG